MAEIENSFKAPFRDLIIDSNGFVSRVWQWFFRIIQTRIYPLGVEKSFTLLNNQVSASNITGMVFNKSGITFAIVEYLVQRVTTGAGAIEKIESGVLLYTYRPTSDDWVQNILSEHSPVDAGIVFSITSLGQVQYTTTNETGTESISNIFYRSRTISGKNIQYSSVNR